MKQLPPQDEGDFDLAQLGDALWNGRKLVGIAVLACMAVSIALAFALPKTYTAETTLLPIETYDVGQALQAGIMAQLGPAAGMLGSLGSNTTDDIIEVLNSRTIAERVIARCKLDRELKGWKYRSDLLKQVRKRTKIVRPALKQKAIRIEFSAPKPELAAVVANTYASELSNILNDIHSGNAAEQRKFLENQLKRTLATLTAAENRLAVFQANNRLTSLPETVVNAIKSLSDLEARRIAANVEIEGTTQAIGALRSQIDSLQGNPNALASLELKKRSLEAQEEALERAKQDFLAKLSTLPPKAMELARLQRDVQLQNTIYLALTQQYETAVIAERKRIQSFVTLDPAQIPERHSKPRRLVIAIVGLIGGALLGSLLALFRKRPHPGSQSSLVQRSEVFSR